MRSGQRGLGLVGGRGCRLELEGSRGAAGAIKKVEPGHVLCGAALVGSTPC